MDVSQFISTPPFPAFSIFRSDIHFELEDVYDKHVILQESAVLNTSGRDWGIGERETHETAWKLTASSPTHYSGTLDHPRSGRFWGSRNRLVIIFNV